MAVLRRVGELSQKLLMRNRPLNFITRTSSEWVSDEHLEDHSEYKGLVQIPDVYPETEEARIKAAEKYGMHPDEYKPYPNDYRYTGDYPELPLLGVETRDPYYPWDYPASRRNYGEPVHKEFDMLGEDRYAFGVRQLVSDEKGTAIFFAIMAGCFFLHMISPDVSQPMMEKQIPGKGTHYTFEMAK